MHYPQFVFLQANNQNLPQIPIACSELGMGQSRGDRPAISQ